MFFNTAQKTLHLEKLINQTESSKKKKIRKKIPKPQNTKAKPSIHEMNCTQTGRRAQWTEVLILTAAWNKMNKQH